MTENYPVFVKWYKSYDWLLDKTEKFPKSVRFTISTRIINISSDIMEGIITAIYSKKKTDILDNINLYIEKLRIFLRICFDRHYLSISQYEFISNEINEVGKMIGGWKKICKE